MKDTAAYARLVGLYETWATLWSLHFREEGVGAEGNPNGHPNCKTAKALVFDAMGVVLREAGFGIRTHEISGSFYWNILMGGWHVASVSLGTPDNLRVIIFDDLRTDVWEPPEIKPLVDAPAHIRQRVAQRVGELKAQADKMTRLAQGLEIELKYL